MHRLNARDAPIVVPLSRRRKATRKLSDAELRTFQILDQVRNGQQHQRAIDATVRGWTSEITRHQRVIDSLETHLRRLQPNDTSTPNH